jgi:hypothetical protein
MNIFKSSTFTWWQLGLFKLSVVTIGIAIGAYWYSVFLPYTVILVAVGLISGVYVGYIWLKQ